MTNDFVISDDTPDRLLFPTNRGRGLDLSSRPQGFAYGGTAEPFPDSLLIPRSEWQSRIEEMEATKSRLSDLCDLANLLCKDQERTNYCWVNAPTYCMEVVRVRQGEKKIILSAASVGAQLTNYRNQGGWGKEALEHIAAKGIVPQDKWPMNAIDKRYATSENLAAALDFRCSEWWEIEPGNLDQYISCLLYRIPVAIGLSWWSHEVSAIDPVWKDGEIAVRFRNSWGMSYGDRGYGILQGRKMMPDDAVAPRVAIGF